MNKNGSNKVVAAIKPKKLSKAGEWLRTKAVMTMLFFVFGILASCHLSLFDPPKCDEPERFFGNKVQFEKYDSKKYFSNDSSRYNMYRFSFNEDSSFSYLRIWYQNATEGIIIQDTTIMLNGKFKISKDSGLPWYVLKLDADYIYEKTIKDTLDGILRFTDFSKSEFKGFEVSGYTKPAKMDIFTNTNSEGALFYKDSLNNADMVDNCFTLYVKSSETRIDAGCGAYEDKGCYWRLNKYTTFCLQQPE